MKIIKISPLGFGANTYVLTADDRTALVVDPSSPRIESELIKLGLTPKYVLLTHCHFDHVGGVFPLQQAGARVLCSEIEKSLIGTEADLSALFNAPCANYFVDETLKDGENRELCGMKFQTLLTPGHTSGSVCYLFEDTEGKYLFTGDTLFAGSIGRTDFPTGDMGQLRKSLARLSALDSDMPVYAGHNEETTLSEERNYNPFLADVY